MKPLFPTSPLAESSTPPIGEYACLIGLDWGDAQHAVSLLERGQSTVERQMLPSQPEQVHRWARSLAERFHGAPVAVALETSKGPIVDLLLGYEWITIYPVHPATSRRYSKAFTPSGAANDQPDADNLLEILHQHRDRLRALLPQDQSTKHLAALVSLRRRIVDARTKLSNELTSLLKSYFPQALLLTGEERHAKIALEFLQRWPNLESLKKARPQTVRSFYYRHHVRRPELVEKRLQLIQEAQSLSQDRVLIQTSELQLRYLLGQFRALEVSLREIEAEIDRVFTAHGDREIFQSLPAAGAAMAPRLCALFGTDRERWHHVSELQKYYGVAPVIEASGKRRWVHWRWNAPAFQRQTLVEWAGITVRYCPWAKAYYWKQRERQKGHSAILRSLAFKWLRILYRCWKDRTPYNDARYLEQLKAKGSYLPSLIPA